MSKSLIRMGDRTTHGGTVVSGNMAWTIDGKAVARVGDLTVCPRCKGIFAITTGAPDVHMFGHAVARQDDLTACGARLIASGNSAWWDTDTNRTDDFFGGENALVEDSQAVAREAPSICLDCLAKAAVAGAALVVRS